MPRILVLCLLSCFAFAARAASEAPFLWDVQGPKARHYLLGSVHLLPQSKDALPAGIGEAYDAAEGIVFEADLRALGTPQTRLALLAAGRADPHLRTAIDAASYKRLQALLDEIGLPKTFCDHFKPWFCALSLEVARFQRAGFTGDNGVDEQVDAAARADDKPVRGLETVTEHLTLIGDMPPAVSRQMLVGEIADQGSEAESPMAVYNAWRNDDVAAVAALSADFKRQCPDVYARLLSGRTRSWLPRLKPILDGAKPQLVVVGAAHLVGSDGLVELLRAKGYRVTPHLAASPDVVQLAPVPRSWQVSFPAVTSAAVTSPAAISGMRAGR